MANDCLVTKLKGNVDNDNLPIYGKVFPNMKNMAKKPENIGIIIYGDADLPVKFKIPVRPYGTQTIITETTVPAGVPYYFNPDPKYVDDLSEIVEIDNMYHLKGFGLEFADAIDECAVGASTPKSAYRSFLQYCNPIAADLHISDIDVLPDSVKYVSLRCDSAERINISHFPKTLDTLKIAYASYEAGTLFLDEDYSNSSITQIEAVIRGDLSYLPNGLTYLCAVTLQDGLLTLEQLIQKFRNAGRTTGHITLRGCHYCNMTYNGTPIRDLYGTVFPSYGAWGWGFVTWDANSINVVGEDPGDTILNISNWIINYNNN